MKGWLACWLNRSVEGWREGGRVGCFGLVRSGGGLRLTPHLAQAVVVVALFLVWALIRRVPNLGSRIWVA